MLLSNWSCYTCIHLSPLVLASTRSSQWSCRRVDHEARLTLCQTPLIIALLFQSIEAARNSFEYPTEPVGKVTYQKETLTFSMPRSAFTLAWRSRTLASCIVTIFFSSTAVTAIVDMVRFMRSGDCTTRDRVWLMASEILVISPWSASLGRNRLSCLNGSLSTYSAFDERIFLRFELLNLLDCRRLEFLGGKHLGSESVIFTSQLLTNRFILCHFRPGHSTLNGDQLVLKKPTSSHPISVAPPAIAQRQAFYQPAAH